MELQDPTGDNRNAKQRIFSLVAFEEIGRRNGTATTMIAIAGELILSTEKIPQKKLKPIQIYIRIAAIVHRLLPDEFPTAMGIRSVSETAHIRKVSI